MTDAVEGSLRRRTWRLLQPGEVSLNGAIVHTDLGSGDDIEMHGATVEVGEAIAAHAAPGADTYVYSGVDDEEFASNQHQGKTVEDEAFVWECQQLLRSGTFDLVFYYPAEADHEAILADVRAAGYAVTGVRGDRPLDEVEADPEQAAEGAQDGHSEADPEQAAEEGQDGHSEADPERSTDDGTGDADAPPEGAEPT